MLPTSCRSDEYYRLLDEDEKSPEIVRNLALYEEAVLSANFLSCDRLWLSSQTCEN